MGSYPFLCRMWLKGPQDMFTCCVRSPLLPLPPPLAPQANGSVSLTHRFVQSQPHLDEADGENTDKVANIAYEPFLALTRKT